MWRFRCLIIGFIFFKAQLLIAQTTLQLIEISDEIDLAPYVTIFEDESNELAYEDVLALTDRFEEYDPESYPFRSGHSYWAKFKIENLLDQSTEWMLYPDWGAEPKHNCFEEVYIDKENEGQNIHEKKLAGHYLPASQKDVAEKPGNKVRLKLLPNEQANVLIRFYKINHEIPRFNPRLIELRHWETFNHENRNLREGMFQGMVWIMILYSFMTFLGTKNKNYLVYLLFLLSTSVFFLYMSGMFSEIFGQEYPKLTHYAWIVSSNILPYAYFQFGRSFIDTPKLIPKWDRYVRYFLYGIIAVLILELLISFTSFNVVWINLLVNLSFLIEALFLLVIAVYFYKVSYFSARIFIFGSLCLVFAAIVGVVSDLLFDLRSILLFIEIAFIAQMLAFAFGMAHRMRRTEWKKLEAEKQMNERLIRADKLKDAFLANTSHELRTPLHGIIGLSENLFEKKLNPIYLQSLAMIISSAKRLTSLVNDLLDFSKLQTSELYVDRKPLDISTVADIALKISEPLVGSKEIYLENKISKDISPVLGDESRVEQILINLLSNGIKFTKKGFVQVSAREDGEWVQVSVSDSGIGISEEKIETVFLAFEQGDGSVSREYSGTGLGLSISRKLVELQGGKLWAESEVNKGSTFHFTLPIARGEHFLAKEKDKRIRLTPLKHYNIAEVLPTFENFSSGEKKVLIVDDEAINQQVLINHLSTGQYTIQSAMNGEEALRYLETDKQFDLVLLDIMMPRMSGYEVCKKLREKYSPSELPIIMITAKNQVSDLVEGFSFGANDYLAKPFTRAEFLARVKAQLNLSNIQAATERFVPRRFIESLGSDSILNVKLGDHIEDTVTVFFSDIRSYTSLSEKMTPTDNFKFVNAYVGRMGPIIAKNNGFVHQYLGDGIMSIFRQKPLDGIQAAIDMQEELRAYNQERRKKGRKDLVVGMGMHTGKLIMGIIGDKFRTDAGTISDTVNTAARMEGLTKFYGSSILVSDVCLATLEEKEKSRLHFRYLGNVKVKGREKNVSIYECLEGDTSEMREKKLANMEIFQQGIEAYDLEEYEQAAVYFRKVIKAHSMDEAAKRYLAQSIQNMVQGVQEIWPGLDVN